MTSEHIAFLLLAFRELSHFSLPGVGALSKTLAGARIDAKTGTIYPPTERFEFTQGLETYTDNFVQLLIRRQRMDAEMASATVQAVADELRNELQQKGSVEVPGIGLFTLVEGAYNFTLTAEDPTLQTFGLKPVSLTQALSEKEIKKELEGTKKDKKAAPPQRTKRDLKNEEARLGKEKKRTRVLIVILIVLLAGLGTTVFVFWEDIETELAKGDSYIALESKPKPKPEPEPKPQPADTLSTDSLQTENTPETTSPEPEPVEEPKPTKKETPKPPRPTTTTTTSTEAPASNTTYQLILTQVFADKAAADQHLQFISGTVIPYGKGYTILLYSSKNKAAVVAQQKKLIGTGDIYPGDSKIIP